jgi:outer membrane protein insertion porin family
LTLPIPLEKFKDWPVRLQLFANQGCLTRFADSSFVSIRSALDEFRQSPRLSVGLGMVVRAKVARVELNYSWPLLAPSHDILRRGLQIGIGMTFL